MIVIALLPALPYTKWERTHALRCRFAPSPSRRGSCRPAFPLLHDQLRTWQQAPFRGRETNLREIAACDARRWAHEIGAYQLGEVVSARVPVIARLVTTELTVVGLCFVAAGLVVLLRRRPRDAALCLIGAFGVIALTTNMSSDEDQGFLLPAFALLWLLAGAGLQWVVCALRDVCGGSGAAVGVGAGTLAPVRCCPRPR